MKLTTHVWVSYILKKGEDATEVYWANKPTAADVKNASGGNYITMPTRMPCLVSVGDEEIERGLVEADMGEQHE